MGQELVSKRLPKWTAKIENEALKESLLQLKQLTGRQVKLLDWGNDMIAVPLTLAIDLPPLGPVDGLDIRSEEPVVLVFSSSSYPQVAPTVYTDRPDLPSKVLAHMYLPKDGKPPGFCLVKGGAAAVAEWYANKRISDVLVRVTNWMRDAAAGVLVLDSGHFDPLRDNSYSGTIIYDYDTLVQIVRDKKSLYLGSDFARLQLEKQTMEKGSIQFKYIKNVPAAQLAEAEAEEEKEAKKGDDDTTRRRLYRGLLLWSQSDQPISVYDDIPRTWDEFAHHFCGKHLIDPQGLEQELLREGSYRFLFQVIIVAIKRPLPILGFSDSIEFVQLSLFLNEENIEDGRIRPQTPLDSFIHSQPLTPAMAERISGFVAETSGITLFAGAGALGSKVALHLIKTGLRDILIADPDNLLPHNFVRHGVSAIYQQQNKAKALALEANLHFPDAKKVSGFSAPADCLLLGGSKLQYEWILDFTASTPFLHQLLQTPISTQTRIAKGYISDEGSLGVLLIEGRDRNPRLDDLQVMLYQRGMDNLEVTAWLQREAKRAEDTTLLTIGIGCSTDTTILSDDVVSLHGSLISGQLKQETKQTISTGSIFVNRVLYEPYFHNVVERLQVLPFSVYNAVNDHSWQVRFAPGIIDTMRKQTLKAKPVETGGVLVGSANYKTKTIHIIDLIDAPPDSKANSVCFIRGKFGLATAVANVTQKTGGQLGYIGEWHSHPNGPEGPSSIDMATVMSLKKNYEGEVSPLPVFLVIITPKNVLPFVF